MGNPPFYETLNARCRARQIVLSTNIYAAPGDLDLAFDPGSAVDDLISDLAVQPDGKILIAGRFDSTQGFYRSKLARLMPDGTTDPSFNSGNITENGVDDRDPATRWEGAHWRFVHIGGGRQPEEPCPIEC